MFSPAEGRILRKSPGQNTNIADDVGDELQEVYVPPESNLEDFGKNAAHGYGWAWLVRN